MQAEDSESSSRVSRRIRTEMRTELDFYRTTVEKCRRVFDKHRNAGEAFERENGASDGGANLAVLIPELKRETARNSQASKGRTEIAAGIAGKPVKTCFRGN